MNQQLDDDAAVAAFIRAKGVTRCPTVCISPTQASTTEADRMALRRREADRDARRTEKKARELATYRFGKVA
jgi:hypothetical protein